MVVENIRKREVGRNETTGLTKCIRKKLKGI